GGEGEAADAAPAWDFKSKAAAEAKRRYDQAVKEHKAAYAKAIRDAERALRADLKSAMQEATKAGDLDEALKLGAAVNHIEKAGVSPREGVALPRGKWLAYSKDGLLGTYDFRRDGSVLWVQKERRAVGKVVKGDGVLVVVYPDDRTERLTPSGRR